MKIRFFDSFAEFDMSGTAGNYEEVTVIRENGWIKCDLMTECKSYKAAGRGSGCNPSPLISNSRREGAHEGR